MQEALDTAAPAIPFLGKVARRNDPARNDATFADRVVLVDGRSLVVRPVEPRDAAAEQAFVSGMSPSTRFRRFHFGLTELPGTMLRAFINADQTTHVALVAEEEIGRAHV